MQLQIQHIEESINKFQVVRGGDGKRDTIVNIVPPDEILLDELQWYLEKYLEMPIGGHQTRAKNVQEKLVQWGQGTFNTLFNSGHARDWFNDAQKQGLSNLHIKISSDNPIVLAWPWEVLNSEDENYLALQCSIERQLCNIPDARPSTDKLPKDKLNILYIIARPRGENDVGFQTLIKPLIDFVFAKDKSWPVSIDVLRPPTFDQLLEVLSENPNFYHIVHFDGHGGYDSNHGGVLVFEKGTDGDVDVIPAQKLGVLLREHNIPVMVLNACQSAMLNKQSAVPFASVAASLMKAGVYSVVAMSYSLWVSGAKEFIFKFYKQLFKNGGNIAEAMRLGRQQMYRNNERDSIAGKVEFNDWIVPVLYQQLPCENNVLPQLIPSQMNLSKLPNEILDLGDYGFIGRERAIFLLDRAVQRQPQAGILIHGMAGEGKTTLAKGFLQWLAATNGLGVGAFWFSFEDIHSAEYIIDTLAEKFFGVQAFALPWEEKFSTVIKLLKTERYFLLWDNFESVSGIPDTEISALISEDGRQMLKHFLHELRNGKTKVIITSRSNEKWLTVQECFRLSQLGGLQGEELWQYCNAVVADLGLKLDRENESYHTLLERLDGNPLAVRAILLRLEEKTATELLDELEEDFKGLQDDESMNRIQKVLAVFGRDLDEEFVPILRLLGLHEHFAYADFIGKMLNPENQDEEVGLVKDCLAVLNNAGLCNLMTDGVYKLHPALRSCLTKLYPAQESDKRVFANMMGSITYILGSKVFHEQQVWFSLFGANFHRALRIARELDMRDFVMALIQGLAVYAQNKRSFCEAERLYKELAKTAQDYNNKKYEAMAYHQLGMIAHERRDFSVAENWYQKSLEMKQKHGNEYGTAMTYHQLGMVAYERRDFSIAEDWYQKSLKILLRLGNEQDVAMAYHELGMIAYERRDFLTAEDFYQKSLKISLKVGNEYDASNTYHQLGVVAYEQCDFLAAEDLYKKSLEISLRVGNEYDTAKTCHELGMVALKCQNFTAAEDWYKKSLGIELKFGNEHGTANTYHLLGIVAEERRDFTAAKTWYQKALEINLKFGDEYGAAMNYYQQGWIAQECSDFTTAKELYEQALIIFERFGDEYHANMAKIKIERLQKLKQ